METPQALRDEPPPRHVNEPQPEATKPSKALDSPAPAQDASQATTGDVKAKVASAVQPSYEELKQRLAETEALLANLKAEMSQGLRQRAAAGSKAVADTVPEDVKAKASELATAVSHQAQQAAQVTEGVSVQTTAILCLLCFLLAYLFF